MTPPKNCTVDNLAKFFVDSRDEIIGEWLTQTATLLRKLCLDGPTITNHVPDVVDEIARDLAFHRDGVQLPAYTRGITPAHGMQRFHDGLDVGEVVAEYNLLRVACNTVAARHGLDIAGEVARIVNHRVDEAVRMSVVAFAAQQALIRREREIEHLSFIAHDLRTPLNAVSLVVGELSRNLAHRPPGQAEELFAVLRRNLRHVEELIAKVLETSDAPIGAGVYRPVRRRIELWPLVQRLLLDLQPISTAQEVEVENAIPRHLTVFADAGLLLQVFQNIIGNAFEYSARGKVTISAREEEACAICTISDNGEGIPAEMLVQVFEKFVTDPQKMGTGLGLAIVKQIVEAHGGTVSAESTLGEGATFTFTLPSRIANNPSSR